MAAFTNLAKGEEIIVQGTVHWARLILPGIVSLFIFLGCARSGGFLAGLVIAAVIMGIYSIPMWTTQLVVTNRRVFGQTGLIRVQTLDTPLDKVNTVSVSSGLIGRIFGYGKIHITSSSGFYTYPSIASPDTLRQSLMEGIERADNERIKRQAEEMAKAMKS